MHLSENIRIAGESLLAGKLRAGLTMLGVVIGVAAVVALVSIGAAVQRLIVSRFDALGTNLLFVYAEQPAGSQRPPELRNADLAALADPLNVPAATAVGAQFLGPATAAVDGAQISTEVAGVTASYPAVRNVAVAAGRFFSGEDEAARARVAVLGSAAAQALFAGSDPVGLRVRLNGMSFEVVGVLAERGSTFGAREDDRVFIPLGTAQQRLFPPPPGAARSLEISVVYVQVADERGVEAAIGQIERTLRDRRGLTYEPNTFSILTQSDLITTFRTITAALTIFLGAIAAISLLVGGIGIMNIMLVVVSERTREIGIRRAVGARRRDIAAQFLVEAILLSVAGGLVGLSIGAGLVLVGELALRRVAAEASAQIDPATVALALGTSVAVGLIFGSYPAVRAARLQPVEALRVE